MTTTCKNCNQNFTGHFCNNCGQSADTHEINFKYFWHEVQHGLLHIDKGILYTTKQLFTIPGNTIREYINGKRVSHFKPIAFAFLLSTIYGLIFHYSNDTTSFDDVSKTFSEIDSENKKNNYGFLKMIFNWLGAHYAYGTLLLIPFFSVASYWAFRKSRYNYFKHLILNTFISGQRTIIYIVLVPFMALLKNKETIEIFGNIEMCTDIILIFWTYIQFFNNNSKLKSFFLTFLFFFIFALIFASLIIIIMITSVVLNKI